MMNNRIETKVVGYLHDRITVRGNSAVDGSVAGGSATESSSAIVASTDPLITGVKNIVLNMIMNIPFLRAKMGSLLENPLLAEQEIHRIMGEVRRKISDTEIVKLRQYISSDHSKNSLLGILSTSFTNILEDGKIDMNDATHFLRLIYDIIQLFNKMNSETNSRVTIEGETLMNFLYFVVKCVIVLTMDDPEEATALGLLDTAFRLVSVSIVPIMKMNCCACLFGRGGGAKST
jgi:uncharacterized protein YneF (UPF0154 family)